MGEGRLYEPVNNPTDQPSCPMTDMHCLLSCPSRDLQNFSLLRLSRSVCSYSRMKPANSSGMMSVALALKLQ